MSSRKFTHAVVIGRFQPIHEGHRTLLNAAFDIADHVIILCGSSNQARTVKNPWSVDERARMITQALWGDYSSSQYQVQGITDYYDDNKWSIEIQKLVDSIVYRGFIDNPSVCLVGHKKDDSSYYLDLFPQYDYVEVDQEGPIDATDVRELYFTENDEPFKRAVKNVLDKAVFRFLMDWKNTDEYKKLQEESIFLADYKSIWKFAPYAPTFVTSDAVVVESGHILLIQRGNNPGKGLWALPGGFLDPSETIEDCAIRELHEETGLKVPKKVLAGSIKKNEVFDAPGRDPRGRFITHAFYFELSPCPDPNKKLTPVKGGDDAAYAEWIPLSKIADMKAEFFLDHYSIIQKMVGGV